MRQTIPSSILRTTVDRRRIRRGAGRVVHVHVRPADFPHPVGDHRDHLNARLSYERIGGTDGTGNKVDGLSPKQTEDGQVVASFKIESHFDIKRAYNPSTGEEQNLIQENTTDRPWYQREYFRVDWSQNLMTDSYDFDTLSMMGLFGVPSTSRSRTPSSIPPTRTRRTSTPTPVTSTSPTRRLPSRRCSICRASAGASTRSRLACFPASSRAARPLTVTATRSRLPSGCRSAG